MSLEQTQQTISRYFHVMSGGDDLAACYTADVEWTTRWVQGRAGVTRVEVFEELRPLLSAVAYRILGCVSEAEDAVRRPGCATRPLQHNPRPPRPSSRPW
jgi:hypothetical protein